MWDVTAAGRQAGLASGLALLRFCLDGVKGAIHEQLAGVKGRAPVYYWDCIVPQCVCMPAHFQPRACPYIFPCGFTWQLVWLQQSERFTGKFKRPQWEPLDASMFTGGSWRPKLMTPMPKTWIHPLSGDIVSCVSVSQKHWITLLLAAEQTAQLHKSRPSCLCQRKFKKRCWWQMYIDVVMQSVFGTQCLYDLMSPW